MGATTAIDLYDQLRDVRDLLEQLHVSGRLSMSSDNLNTRWVDVADAARAAQAALDVAIDALAWMDTRPA